MLWVDFLKHLDSSKTRFLCFSKETTDASWELKVNLCSFCALGYACKRISVKSTRQNGYAGICDWDLHSSMQPLAIEHKEWRILAVFSEKLGDVHFVPCMDDIKWEYKSLIDGSCPPSDVTKATESSGIVPCPATSTSLGQKLNESHGSLDGTSLLSLKSDHWIQN